MKTAFRPLALALSCLAASFGAVAPAGAQLFWLPPDTSAPPVTGLEPTSGVNLPGATPDELRAGLLWNLRAALNVAALQCDFEPTLLTVTNYNAAIAQHRLELASAFDTLGKYFTRTNGTVAGKKAFDQYGTRVYSGYSTVQAQRNFCQVAGSVGRDAIFAPRGQLYTVAQNRLGELRKSLAYQPDRIFGNPAYGFKATLPPLDPKCWKNGEMTKKCAKQWAAMQGG